MQANRGVCRAGDAVAPCHRLRLQLARRRMDHVHRLLRRAALDSQRLFGPWLAGCVHHTRLACRLRLDLALLDGCRARRRARQVDAGALVVFAELCYASLLRQAGLYCCLQCRVLFERIGGRHSSSSGCRTASQFAIKPMRASCHMLRRGHLCSLYQSLGSQLEQSSPRHGY